MRASKKKARGIDAMSVTFDLSPQHPCGVKKKAMSLDLRPQKPHAGKNQEAENARSEKDVSAQLMRDFVFSSTPLLYDPLEELREMSASIDSGDETDPEDHEARIRTSWHHRALLGDENRILYTEPEDDVKVIDDEVDEETNVVF